MNLLDTVLCTSNAQEYASNFKQYAIDAHTLKLLNDEDLKILGIVEEEKRASILEHAANLQIPAEQLAQIVIDQKYIISVLAQMSVHLTKHLAALSIAVCRQDVIICNCKLFPATRCLNECVRTLGQQLDEFEEKVTTRQEHKPKYKKVVIPAAITASIGLISLTLYYILKS